MKISIITVSYNSERFIRHCISSVTEQTYGDIEYIIIDGNSKDGTLDIIKSFKNIRYVSENDEGIYDALNKGIRMATGDVIGILNSDDFFADVEVLNRVSKEFIKDPFLDAVYSDVLFVESTDISKTLRYYSSKFFKPVLFRYGFQPAHPTFYAKRALFEKYGYYRTDLKIAGDFDLMLRFMVINRITYKYVNDLWVKMRVGGISTSGLKSMINLNREILKSCRDNDIYSNCIMVYSKYLVKWWGFLNRGSSKIDN